MNQTHHKWHALFAILFVLFPVSAVAAETIPFLTPQELDSLPLVERMNYIELVQKNPTRYSPPANALVASSTTQTITELIADVRLQDCSYTQATSTDQTIRVSCTITNKFKTQGDIHYGLQLFKEIQAGFQEIVDTKVYDQTLSLKENQTTQLHMTYVPPNYLSGMYKLLGVLRTSSGLPLASNILGTITLKATATSYLEIKSDTCLSRAHGKATTTTAYNIPQGFFTVSPDDTLETTCSVVAHAANNMTVTPSLATYKESIFGDIVAVPEITQRSFIFNGNETKTISFIIPKIVLPQSYTAVLSLISPRGEVISNRVALQYTVSGPSATIHNILLDKDSYVSGDMARVSFFLTASIPPLVTGVTAPSDTNAPAIIISIKDNEGIICAQDTITPSTNAIERNILETYPLRVMRLCVNPNVSISIADSAGILLGQKSVTFTSDVPERATQDLSTKRVVFYSLIIFSVLAAAGVALYIRRRKNIV